MQASTFVYDSLGNLEQRDFMSGAQLGIPDVTETFTYDALNRLKTGNLNSPVGVFDKTYAYDAVGNITNKSDFADQYFYGQTANAGPHAVTTVKYQGATIGTYQYDANGNMTNGGGRSISYSWFNKPTSVTEGSEFSSFSYDTNHMRIVQTSSHGVSYYLNPRIDKGGHYEKEFENGNTIHKHFIYGPNGVVGVHKETDYGSNNVIDAQETNYFLKDHLGSIELVTNAAGSVVERFSYDAFGKRRNLDGRDSITRIIGNSTHHGFTGHEHLDHVGLIHMNGRLYDPDLGRFTSADPYVKFATSTQGFNRYSYTDNNPLTRVDLNGYGWNKFKKWVKKNWKTVAIVVLAAYTGYLAYDAAYWATAATSSSFTMMTVTGSTAAGAASGAIMGGAMGYASTGTLRGALTGAFEGGVTGAISGYMGGQVTAYYGDTWNAGRVISNGVVDGARTTMNGGSFKDGFRSGVYKGLAKAGFNYMKDATNRSSELSGNTLRDENGRLFTYGGRPEVDAARVETYDHSLLAGLNMTKEVDGQQNSWWGNGFIRDTLNDVSKVHDYGNSWAYNDYGEWVSRGTAYDTSFNVFSMSTMLPAAAYSLYANQAY